MADNRETSVAMLRHQAEALIAEATSQRRPILIRKRGKPCAWLVDADSFEWMHARIALLEGLVMGEAAIAEDRVLSHDEARRRLLR